MPHGPKKRVVTPDPGHVLPKRGSVHLRRKKVWHYRRPPFPNELLVTNVVEVDNPALDKYERDILSGKIECPFTVVHKNSRGEVVANKPIDPNKDRKLYFN